MPVRVQCPACSAGASLPDSVRGKTVKVTCKKCGKKFTLKPRSNAGVPASSTKVQSSRRSPPPAPAGDDFAFDSDAPPPRRASGRRRGRGGIWLVIAGLGGIAVLALGTLAYLTFNSWSNSTKLAQASQKGTDQAQTAKDTSKEAQPAATAQDGKKTTSKEDKKPEEKKPPDKMPPEKPIDKPPLEKPPVTPKVEHVSKTPDGAMTLVAHPEKHLRFTAVSPDGKTLYTAAWDNQLRLWDTAKFEPKADLPLPKPDSQPNSRLQAALSPDGKSLLFAHWDILQVMDLETKKVEVFEGMPKEEHGLGQIVLSADGRTAVTNWATVSYALWRIPDRKFVSKLAYDGMGLARGQASALVPDGSCWIHAPQTGNGVQLRALPDGRDLGSCSGPEKPTGIDASIYVPTAPVLSPKGKLLAYAQVRKGGRSIRVFDFAKRIMLHDLPLTKHAKETLDPQVTSMAIAPDEKLLVVLDSHRWLHGFDLEKGAFLGAIAFPRPNPSGTGGDDEHTVLFTNDGRRLIAAACNLVKVWERDTLVWPKPEDPVNQPRPPGEPGVKVPPNPRADQR